MNVFEEVKAKVSPRAAAERFGLQVSSNGMARCPFHDDRHPSLKLYDDHFYCFGCGATGDVIEFTSKLFGITALEAAKKLKAYIGIQDDKPSIAELLNQLNKEAENERLCYRVLQEYLHTLEDWKQRYAPRVPEEEPDDRFAEACRMLDCTQYMLDVLAVSPALERREVVKDMMKDGKIAFLQERLRKIKRRIL